MSSSVEVVSTYSVACSCSSHHLAIATIPKPTGVCPASPSTSGVPTCSDIRQCQVDYQCPLARKCCSGIATTGGPTCVGKICRCSVLTLAECQPYCPPALGHSKIGIGADNCTTCLCVPNATIPPRTTSMPHTTATTVKSQTATSGITFVPDTLPGMDVGILFCFWNIVLLVEHSSIRQYLRWLI